jgi:hypothetical protein
MDFYTFGGNAVEVLVELGAEEPYGRFIKQGCVLGPETGFNTRPISDSLRA